MVFEAVIVCEINSVAECVGCKQPHACMPATAETDMHACMRRLRCLASIAQNIHACMRRHNTIADIAYCLYHTRRCAYTRTYTTCTFFF